jgi:hypothetical protein
MMAEPIDWKAHHATREDAEKDLAFALVALQSGQGAKAFLNAAVALVRIGQTLLDSEWKTVLAAGHELRGEG